MFPSISHIFFHWSEPKSIAKLDGGAMAGFAPPLNESMINVCMIDVCMINVDCMHVCKGHSMHA